MMTELEKRAILAGTNASKECLLRLITAQEADKSPHHMLNAWQPLMMSLVLGPCIHRVLFSWDERGIETS